MARGDTQEGSAKAAVHLLVKCTNIVRACTLYYKCVDNLATAVVGFQMILYYTFTHHSAVTQRFFLLVLVLVLFWGPPRFLAAFFFPPCAAAPRPLIISFQFETTLRPDRDFLFEALTRWWTPSVNPTER